MGPFHVIEPPVLATRQARVRVALIATASLLAILAYGLIVYGGVPSDPCPVSDPLPGCGKGTSQLTIFLIGLGFGRAVHRHRVSRKSPPPDVARSAAVQPAPGMAAPAGGVDLVPSVDSRAGIAPASHRLAVLDSGHRRWVTCRRCRSAIGDGATRPPTAAGVASTLCRMTFRYWLPEGLGDPAERSDRVGRHAGALVVAAELVVEVGDRVAPVQHQVVRGDDPIEVHVLPA
jgi:hypothetical protein